MTDEDDLSHAKWSLAIRREKAAWTKARSWLDIRSARQSSSVRLRSSRRS